MVGDFHGDWRAIRVACGKAKQVERAVANSHLPAFVSGDIRDPGSEAFPMELSDRAIDPFRIVGHTIVLSYPTNSPWRPSTSPMKLCNALPMLHAPPGAMRTHSLLKRWPPMCSTRQPLSPPCRKGSDRHSGAS